MAVCPTLSPTGPMLPSQGDTTQDKWLLVLLVVRFFGAALPRLHHHQERLPIPAGVVGVRVWESSKR